MYLLKLRNILLHNTIYILILFITIYVTVLRIVFEKEYSISDINLPVISIINNYSIDGNKLVVDLSKYNIRGTYYIKTKQEKKYLEKNIKVGDKYKITGTISLPNTPTTKGLFNYKNYLKTKKINYLIEITSINKISNNKNIIYLLKNIIINQIKNNPYLNTFLLGNKSYLNEETIYSFQENGISHLFAISGMHITLLSNIVLKILKKIKVTENKSYFITSLLLVIYLLIVGLSPSIIRGVLFFILFSINNIYYLYIKSINLFIIALSITLIINPFYIYDIGFIYSFAISLSLILSTNYLKSNNYLLSLLKTSYISFISSLPITLYNYCSINVLSIFYNLIYVPFVSIIIFPLSLVVMFIPILTPIYNVLTLILEKSSIFLSSITIGKFIFKRLNIFVYIILFIIIINLIIILNNKKRNYLNYIYIFLLINYIYPYFINYSYIIAIDVGQGDSILLNIKNKTILVDTGGIKSYSQESWQKKNRSSSIVKNTTIPILKSLGIKKIDYLILTHGDYDHMGESSYLVSNYKVDNVIFNKGKYNYLELDLIEKLEDKKIPYFNNIEKINIKNNELYFLNNKDYGNENDNSIIIYMEIDNKKILLMGDAGVKVEEDLIKNYSLSDIDILKVGHHGSNTSSSKKFISSIKPKTCLISVGRDNKFGHPKDNVIETLDDYCTIYRTDINGSIEIKQ